MLKAVSNLKELQNLRIFVHELTPNVIKEVAVMIRSLKHLTTFTLDYQTTAYAKEPLPDLTDLSQLNRPEYRAYAELANAIMASNALTQMELGQKER